MTEKTASLVSEKINALEASKTVTVTQKSRDLRAQGIDVISLSVGEPDFGTPDHIKEAAIQAIQENYTHYTPIPGYDTLLEAISSKLQRENNLSYSKDQIIVSCGAKHSIYNVLQCVINPGDEVIIPCPYWVSYSQMVKLSGGKAVFIQKGMDDDFKVNANDIRSVISSKTKALILNSPSNPTGAVYTREELEAIAKVVAEYPSCIIVADEIYEHIIYEGKHESIAQFSFIKDQVAIVNGVSKGYAMTGWRIGYLAAPEWLVKATNKLQGQLTSGVSSISQMASIAALTGTMEPTYEMREKFRERRNLAAVMIKDVKGFEINIPQAAFYLFPKVSQLFGTQYKGTKINNATDLSEFLLDEARVATVTGDAFGAPSYIRLSYATSNDKIIEALTRIKNAVDLLG